MVEKGEEETEGRRERERERERAKREENTWELREVRRRVPN